MSNFYVRWSVRIFGAALIVELLAVVVAVSADGVIQALAILLAAALGFALVLGTFWVAGAILGTMALLGFLNLFSRGGKSQGNPRASGAPLYSGDEQARRRRTVIWD